MPETVRARSAELAVEFNGADITKDIRPYLLSAVYTDCEDDDADDLQLTLQDRDEALELLKCQRHQVVYPLIKNGNYWVAVGHSSTQAMLSVSLPSSMRSNPSLTFDKSKIVLYDGEKEYVITDITIYARSQNTLTYLVTSTGLNNRAAYVIRALADTKVIFDSNL